MASFILSYNTGTGIDAITGRTETTVARDGHGNIVKATQIETDLEKQ